MNTNESVLFQGLSNLVRQNLLPAIVQHLATKGVQVSVDELANVLKLAPNTAVVAPQQLSAASVAPSFNMGVPSMGTTPGFGGIASATPSLMGMGGMPLSIGGGGGAKKGSKKNTATAPPPENERCQYVFTRGRNKNDRCPNRCEPGHPFCSGCKGKKTAQDQLTRGAPGANSSGAAPGLPGVLPSLGAVPGVQTGNGTFNQLNPSLAGTLAAPVQEPPKLQVKSIGDGLYHEVKHNLVIKTGNQPGSYICCGVIDPKTNITSPLTADKIEICKQFNLSYVDPSKANGTPVEQSASVSVTGQVLPNVSQQLPGVNGNMSAPPQVNMSLPGLPTVAANSAGVLSGLPTINGVGVLPGVPAITDNRSADEPIDDDDDDVDDDGDE